MSENKYHRILKDRATSILSGWGCKDIVTECRVKVENNRVYIVDVAGLIDEKLVIIECGGSSARKMDHLLKLTGEIYILPYGDDQPIKWQEGMFICHQCGHILPYNLNRERGSYLIKQQPSLIEEICLLRQNGGTYRGIAQLVGLSHERVRQLLPEKYRGHIALTNNSIKNNFTYTYHNGHFMKVNKVKIGRN